MKAFGELSKHIPPSGHGSADSSEILIVVLKRKISYLQRQEPSRVPQAAKMGVAHPGTIKLMLLSAPECTMRARKPHVGK